MSLQKTTNYSLFEVSNFNRDVTKTKKLELSMKKHGFIEAYPLHVVKNKGKLEIKGGHHRFEVASRLGIAIPYVICTDKASIHELEEASNTWSMDDYLTSFVRMGDPDYIAVKEYKDKTGISTRQCMSMLGGEIASSGNHAKEFKNGEYSLSNDLTHAYQIAELVKVLNDAGLAFATKSNCVGSLSRIMSAGHADFDTLKKKIKTNILYIENQRTQDGFVDMWDEIYNRKTRGNRVPLAFLTNETMKQRALDNLARPFVKK